MKYKDLSEEEQEEHNSLLDCTHKPKERKGEGFGLCSTCKNFYVTKSEFKVLSTKCSLQGNIKITIEDPIRFCSIYSKLGEMSLYEMSQIALFIDLDEEKGKVGF